MRMRADHFLRMHGNLHRSERSPLHSSNPRLKEWFLRSTQVPGGPEGWFPATMLRDQRSSSDRHKQAPGRIEVHSDDFGSVRSRGHFDPCQLCVSRKVQSACMSFDDREMVMSKLRLNALVASAWVVVSPAAAKSDRATLSFATPEAHIIALPTAEPDSTSGSAEWSRTCTYQGGPKSGNWACR